MPELLSSKMPRQISAVPVSTLTTVLVAMVAIAALYFGREVLVPIALAMLLSFVLAPFVDFLQRWYFPRVVAVLVVGLFAFSTIFGLGALMVCARSEQADALSMSRIFSWDVQGIALICLCYVEYATPAQIRYAIRRIRRRSPDVHILVALFGNAERIEGEEEAGTEFVQQSLRQAVDKILAVASKEVEAQLTPIIPVAA